MLKGEIKCAMNEKQFFGSCRLKGAALNPGTTCVPLAKTLGTAEYVQTISPCVAGYYPFLMAARCTDRVWTQKLARKENINFVTFIL